MTGTSKNNREGDLIRLRLTPEILIKRVGIVRKDTKKISWLSEKIRECGANGE